MYIIDYSLQSTNLLSRTRIIIFKNCHILCVKNKNAFGCQKPNNFLFWCVIVKTSIQFKNYWTIDDVTI